MKFHSLLKRGLPRAIKFVKVIRIKLAQINSGVSNFVEQNSLIVVLQKKDLDLVAAFFVEQDFFLQEAP